MKLLVSVLAFMSFMNVMAQNEPVETGKYEPDWESLKQWECPEWFKDAKFGIWAHWGPQCHAESGDWYGRHMYYENEWQSRYHAQTFGWMSDYGLKELCRDWKGENWNPDELIAFYKSVGARYFMTLGNHHDNFDLWNSPYQEWNSVNIGPKKDIVKGWADACDKYGLPLGVSMHASHAWTWLEMSRHYDGLLTKADGAGQWWEGYDPQELYAQDHEPSTGYENVGTIHSQWAWGNGASQPSAEYKMKFQNRVIECINTFSPDMIYFDDTVLPFYGCDESVGLNILSHYYNTSAKQNGGEQQVVVTGKILEKEHKDLMLWDVERGIPDRPQEKYWQTCTCLGTWHYDKGTYERSEYKSAQQVVSMLVDIVSKNGNMLLSVPIRSNGTIDEKEEAVLQGIKEWMDVNGQSIYGTRPWTVFGEGPLAEASNPLNSQGFNEGNNYSSADVRFVQRNDTVFATTLRYPTTSKYVIETFGLASKNYNGKVKKVTLLGHGAVDFELDIDGLVITMPETPVNKLAAVFAVEFDENSATTVSLEELISIYEEKVVEMREQSSYNTGKFSREKVNEFADLVEEQKQYIGADDISQQLAIKALHTAYNELCDNGTNEGGAPNETNSWDYTTDYLVEASGFSRLEETGTRFAAPLNWTVENFCIPNGADGIKKGLDNYGGTEALMLGVWNDRDANEEGDLSNARIYRTVHLDAGRYYFGARYNALYQLSDQAYIFTANSLCDSYDLPEQSIAYARLNKGSNDGSYYGIYFTLEEEQDVVLGFQVNLLEGSATQEARAEEVKLLYYGAMDYYTLDDFRYEIEDVIYTTEANDNTGYYSKAAIADLQKALDTAMLVTEDASYEEIIAAYNALTAAYEHFKTNGKNQGGAPVEVGAQDITVETFSEADNFARTDETLNSGRFGAPKYWTVENYGFGSQAGLDNITGQDCLHLEVWWNNGSFAQNGYDITKARLYQQVTLAAGRYYFGAAYPSAESNEDAYIFASENLLETADISTQSIAYEKVNRSSADGSFRGLYFTLEEETTLYLGFQADFSKVNTANIRAKAVKLLYYGEINYDKLQELIAGQEAMEFKLNDNTGYYSAEAYSTLAQAISDAKKVEADASMDEIITAYNAINAAYEEFLKNGKNPGGIPEEIGSTDITVAHLVEAGNFSRLDPTVTTRFSTPKYWTVDNFNIQTTTGEGIRGGLDKYPGFDCLMLGVWNDKGQNVDGDLTNSRIYRKVSLEAGRYFFGAAYNTVDNLGSAYIYVADAPLNTTDITTQSIAYYPIMDSKNDGNYYGLYFTLDKAQDVVLAFQVDIQNGRDTQEFRASKVVLLSYNGSTSIDTVEDAADKATPDFSAPAQYYSITGQQLNTAPQQGLFIMRQGGNSFKIYRK